MTDAMTAALTATRAGDDVDDLYGDLIGTWDVGNRYTDDATGEWRTGTAVWTFGRVLAGRAVQDVMWFTDSDGNRSTGSTVRLYDPAGSCWHVVWFSPTGRVATLTGRAGAGRDIVQEGRRGDGRLVRWVFTERTESSFRWLGHVSGDGGATWEPEQEMRARRRAG